MSHKILNRFEELIKEANEISNNSFVDTNIRFPNFEDFPPNYQALYSEWIIKAQNILLLACGDNSIHFTAFKRQLSGSSDTPKRLRQLIPILNAAYDDLKNGFLITFKQIVQAEVFESELEQAKSLLESGYKNAAAVIAGVVLETAIKELCQNNGIDLEKKNLNRLNEDLVKAGVYNTLQQKQILALADIRNKAAHGDYDEFTKEDVERMISDIERFLLNNSY
ncbi:HEPN domain-containing protein [Acinetobacter baumannii]|nr:HEPN domain-containing protein [Acinetobacter baumannii]MDC4602467.1 HEPN domain-containing protein [Acinetobacter baumannii]MDC4872704.1 HEPN domain-containing protein [Acinetobacter baumannii]MDC4945317.1 HEPN domain-containing protein [Acinetobacter baumannii]MDC5113293.1 HEPN domain-containing protein [Acinetobacter baumannii]